MPELAENTTAIALPPRRVAQLKRVIAGEPVGQASMAVGYKTKQAGSNALADTRRRLLAAMEKYAVTPESFVRDYMLPLMNATQTQYFAFNGAVTDERTDPDNSIRLAALRETGKLMGLYPKEDSGGPSHLAITLNNVQVTD
jgi:hypothetical protein